MFYLDDLVVGQRFESKLHTLDASQVRAFAQQFDPQPFHLDSAAAAETFFHDVVASGWQTACITMRLLVDGGLPLAGGIVGTSVTLSWPQPTHVTATLRVSTEITAIQATRPVARRGTVIACATTYNERNEAVQILTARVIVHRRPAALPAKMPTP